MSEFPELRPDRRSYNFGVFPFATESDIAGGSVRFLHGDSAIRLTMQLSYEGISQAEATELRDHYRGQQGSHIDFQLPDVIWAGHSSVDNIVPAGQHWRYGAELEEDHVSGGTLINVTATLVTAKCPVAGAFDPLTLSPLAWWDASDASTVTVASGRVSAWDDKSGNGWHLSQADSGRRPVHSAAAINGLDAMDWMSGSANPWMQTSASSFTAEEFYFVVRHDGGTGFQNYSGLFNPADNSVDGWFTGNAFGLYSLFFSVPTYVNGGTTDEQAILFPALASTCLVRCRRTAGTFTTTSGVVVGFDRLNTASPRAWPGFICEGLAFATELDPTDRASLETYLMCRWGIA
jgi:hypothetical protein